MQDIDLKMKKVPRQARSKATVNSIIQACSHILVEDGYQALTTNKIANVAGVGIGSLYEYFPGKEAIVAAMTQNLIEGHMSILNQELVSINDLDFEKAMRHWIGTLYGLVINNKKLLHELIFEVPYNNKLIPIPFLQQQLLQLVMKGAARSHEQYEISTTPETLFLITSTTAGTILGLAFSPQFGMASDKILDELSATVIGWLLKK